MLWLRKWGSCGCALTETILATAHLRCKIAANKRLHREKREAKVIGNRLKTLPRPPHSDVERRSHRPRRCRGSAAPPCASTAPTGRRRERTRPSSLLPTGASLRSASRRRYRTSRGRNAPRANVTPEGYRTSRGRHAPRAVVAVGSAASSSKAEKPWGSILPLFGELLFS